jgi:hypothetical protein
MSAMFKTNEHATVSDDVLVNGKRYNSNNSADIIGDVEVIYQSKHNGKVIFTRKLHGHNDLLVTGGVFLSEKANDIRSSFKTVPLDLELGVHTSEQIENTSRTISREKIAGIMVGNGGAGDTYNSVYKVTRSARSVPGMLPFRVVPTNNDLASSDREKYFLRVVKGDYAYYYGKKFDIDREIYVLFEDGTSVPIDVDTTPTTKFIKTFTKYRAVLDERDIREFFKINYGSTLRSLINSVGLVTGYPGDAIDGGEEFFNVRGMTTMNMENQELKDSESTITFIYRLFIQ